MATAGQVTCYFACPQAVRKTNLHLLNHVLRDHPGKQPKEVFPSLPWLACGVDECTATVLRSAMVAHCSKAHAAQALSALNLSIPSAVQCACGNLFLEKKSLRKHAKTCHSHDVVEGSEQSEAAMQEEVSDAVRLYSGMPIHLSCYSFSTAPCVQEHTTRVRVFEDTPVKPTNRYHPCV